MSFIGSINAETRKWLGNNGQAFDGRQVYVGCSGAFTVEQLLTRYAPKARLWGNDVSLYSGVLGAYLTDQQFPLEIAEETRRLHRHPNGGVLLRQAGGVNWLTMKDGGKMPVKKS